MNPKIILSTILILITSTSMVAAQDPLKAGTYRCVKLGKTFELTGGETYVDSKGRQGTYRFDRGLNSAIFDTGEQYFRGGEDLMILVQGGQLSNIGCNLQR